VGVPIERFRLVEDYGEAVLAGSAALFIGAGLSRSAGLPDWAALLAPLRDRCNIPEHHDLPLVAEYIANDSANGGRCLVWSLWLAVTSGR